VGVEECRRLERPAGPFGDASSQREAVVADHVDVEVLEPFDLRPLLAQPVEERPYQIVVVVET